MSHSIRLVFLGTGAAVPSLRRALPTLALVFPGEIVLCDCSEGTQQRLMSAGLSPSRIIHIFISHLHGDHIFGLPGLITSQHLLNRDAPMHLWGPTGLGQYLAGITAATGHQSRFPLYIHEWDTERVEETRLENFTFSAAKLEHSKPCYGFRICANPRYGRFDLSKAEALGVPPGPARGQLQHGKSIYLENGRLITSEQVVGPVRHGPCIAYCTDTRPCSASVELARGADILLHDCTFTEDLQQRARETGHSTAAEAATVAQAAGVQRLFLWHLSVRNDTTDDQSMLDQARAVFHDTQIPDDLSSWTLPFPKD